MNRQSYASIPPQTVDMLHAKQDLIVTARYGSVLQQQALEEIVTSTWTIGNNLLVICSDVVFAQVATVLKRVVTRTSKPREGRVFIQPDPAHLFRLDNREPSLILVTAKHLFSERFPAQGSRPLHSSHWWSRCWPRTGTILAIGLDMCANAREAALFEACWQYQHGFAENKELRRIVMVQGAKNLDVLAAYSKAQIARIELCPSQWRFESVLYDREICGAVLKAYITSRASVLPSMCLDWVEECAFPVQPDGHADDKLVIIADASLDHLVNTGQISLMIDQDTEFCTAFPNLWISTKEDNIR